MASVYVVRDASGEYISGRYDREDSADQPNRTPAADEARGYETREDAEAACRRETDRVLSRDAS
jgi:hypothetical protein